MAGGGGGSWFGGDGTVGGAASSPVLEEVEMLEDDIDMVTSFDDINDEADELSNSVAYLQQVNSELQNENASLQNEEVQLKSQLAGTDRRMHELENELAHQPAKVQGAQSVDVDYNSDILGTPERHDAFFVGEVSFKTKNEALQYEVLQALVDKNWCNGDEYDDGEYDTPLERIRETYQMPLGTLADNIDKIAMILREYEQKKDR